MSDDRSEVLDKPSQFVPELPGALAKKYLRVGSDIFRSSDDKKPIATLGRDKITTRNADALRDLIQIASANGWMAIRIEGSPEFRRRAYLEASLQGMAVEGYRPSQLVEAEAERNRTRFAQAKARRDKRNPAISTTSTTPALPKADALAERFLRQSHAENAKDKDLRGAQSLVALAIATARGQYPDDLNAQDKYVAAKKTGIARSLARGEEITGVELVVERPQVSGKPTPLVERSPPSRLR